MTLEKDLRKVKVKVVQLRLTLLPHELYSP